MNLDPESSLANTDVAPGVTIFSADRLPRVVSLLVNPHCGIALVQSAKSGGNTWTPPQGPLSKIWNIGKDGGTILRRECGIVGARFIKGLFNEDGIEKSYYWGLFETHEAKLHPADDSVSGACWAACPKSLRGLMAAASESKMKMMERALAHDEVRSILRWRYS